MRRLVGEMAARGVRWSDCGWQWSSQPASNPPFENREECWLLSKSLYHEALVKY